MNALINFFSRSIGAKTADQNLDSTKVFKFNGGIELPAHKSAATSRPIRQLPIPDQLLLPLGQYTGYTPKICVQVGAHVLKGQLLAAPDETRSAAVHAPTSGTVTAISAQDIAHPSGRQDLCVTLITDGKDTWTELTTRDWQHTDKKQLIDSLRLSGIAALASVRFPSETKSGNTSPAKLHTIVINAVESEPYVSCDDMLLRERAAEIVHGIAIVQHLLDADQCIIAIEDSKPEALLALTAAGVSCKKSAAATFAARTNIAINIVPSVYPSADTRLLAQLLLGIEVACDKSSADMGVQVLDVATVVAIYRYVAFGEPAISRIVTMAGNVLSPGNFEVLFGTPLMALVGAAGGAKADTTHFIMGGPMTGLDLANSNVPITQASNCIIAASPALFSPAAAVMPCIRCARCAEVCPINLQPQQLFQLAESADLAGAQDQHLADCIECGCCSYVCPSNIPLVDYFRDAKTEIMAASHAKAAADLARERYSFRLARLARDKQERAEKHAQRAQLSKTAENAALADTTSVENHDHLTQTQTTEQAGAAAKLKRQALIAAAIARVQAQTLALTPQSTENAGTSADKKT
jgi:electron transport complex protein RnfC